MTQLKTFAVRGLDGTIVDPEMPYHPMRITVDGKQLTLALHRYTTEWRVFDPATGARVITVYGSYKGATVNSSTMTMPEARRHARDQVQELVDRVGSERFLAVLDAARQRFAQEA